ncbi:aldehyde dehydrogenase [Erythrobacter sp. QSSC1-22B]|uniref:aldehyde dehydrogenase family protein n=1 Tax=Erythrobacter sp. QSSC1-22B TaxID=1860125 RepID=UPI000804843D|nr:aldehyde dehydrogenase family protein [Erythrobacter sp. QSSC1-22B]OBX19783.1 aldehyde dehydrogenase [Erythrobacter sp. QSSC1-22B]
MSILTQTEQVATVSSVNDDGSALKGLRTAFADQRKAFAAERYPTLAVRSERIQALMGMLVGNRARIREALSSDFGHHPAGASDLIEMLGIVGRAQFVLENLERWMAPISREIDPAALSDSKAFIRHEPKGVVGNIVPWNFPIDIALGPLAEMLGAGNRVIIKPSEFAPACAELVAEMVKATYDPNLVHVTTGGLELSRAFAATPFDHLLYTGSPDVGRQVMAAAAQNLTPVTLELGGKCPAVLTPGSINAKNIESIIGTKLIKNGQMCISVDYALVPRDDVDGFVQEARKFMDRAAPDYSKSDDCTGIISDRHLSRIEGMLSEAEERQVEIIQLEDDGTIDRETRRMPISLIINPPADLQMMREEIFGPLLPVVPYDDLEDAIAHINSGERPLGLYVFGSDPEQTDRVLSGTSSGGAAVNTCALQGGLPSLAFGGSGNSGMGRHHGIEGFREFSNPRGIVVRGDEPDHIDAFYAPYSKAEAMVAAALGQQ